MAIKLLDEASLSQEVASGITIVDYAASWCAPCKVLYPILDEFSNKYATIKVAKVDIEKNIKLASQQKIMNVPCLLVFKDGVEVERKVGFKNRDDVEKLFIKYA